MSQFKTIFLSIFALMLAGCASEVNRYPVQISQIADNPARLVATKTISFALDLGYARTIKAGSVFKQIARTEKGTVLKPVNTVFTVEGAQVHEAYPVLQGNRIVGFYLPVERAFSPLKEPVLLPLQEEKEP